jgi:Myosin head (motor domain)
MRQSTKLLLQLLLHSFQPDEPRLSIWYVVFWLINSQLLMSNFFRGHFISDGILPFSADFDVFFISRTVPVLLSFFIHATQVTGRAVSEYFFDPTLILDENTPSGGGLGGATPFKTPKRQQSIDGNGGIDSIIFSSRHLYHPCTIVKSLEDSTSNGNGGGGGGSVSGPALVKTSDGTLYKVRDAQRLLPLTSPDDYVGMDDVLHLANVTEASLLHTLRIRYKRDEIYTNAGPILISVNPYKPITVGNGESLYSEKMMMKYRTSESFSNEAPHLFQVADRAYSAMMDSIHSVPHLEDEDPSRVIESPRKFGISPGQVVNQSIIISGESGAGKTEATKYIMQYLARITKKKGKWTSDDSAPVPFFSPDGKVLAALEDRVLSSNPLLETFGNAQTLRNDNSSRFGKFIHINFSTEKGIIVGARISNYLLEKTRITTQIEGERNYHIFYQLFSGASQDQLKDLGLDEGTKVFRYLGNRSFVKNQKDTSAFTKTMQCLRNVGLATEEQNALLGVAAAVLHIGNISFEEKDGNEEHVAVITEASRPSLTKACELLGLKEDDVTEAILTKLLTIGGKSIKKTSTVSMAEDKRDALAKMTYSSLFLWLVSSINRTLSQQGMRVQSDNDRIGFIGVLDIYGFECFENNGYEQLLINYCNEKLQRHFNRHLFEVEQNLYSTEGVDWTYITFNDNQPCLELIEGGNGVVGILNTLDDSYAGMGSSTEKDVKFVSQLHNFFGSVAGAKKTNGGHDYFVTPKFGNDRQFIISHYAGEVRYTADGFVEKNMESLSNELKDLGSTSEIPFARDVFESADEQQTARRSSIRGFSVASQFKLSLQSLVDDLESTQPLYIRCIKPNLNKAANSFSSGEVLKQLRYSGMMEAIRIRREGYALREEHQSFFNRFSVLLGCDAVQGTVGIEQLVTILSTRLNVTDADWQIGHTKIFLRRELSDKLERLARLRVHRAVRTVGRFGRNVARRRSGALIVAWVRFRLVIIKVRRTHRAASRIASTYRMHVQSRTFKVMIEAVIKIQSQHRKALAIQTVRKLQDPYWDMNYKDLKNLLTAEKARMEEAITAKDFQRAATIESEINSLKIAIEERQPMTRTKLEEKLSVAQASLDDAIQRKAYKEAGPLQDEVEKLTALRAEYPTIDELKAALAQAEDAVANAAKNRDFTSAATLQSDVDKAKKRLENALSDEAADEDGDKQSEDSAPKSGADAIDLDVPVDGIESRADLEEQISALHNQVEEAIAKKDFQLASSLQEKVDNKEKLRSFFPSLEELEVKLRAARDKLDEAISSKDFATAGKLHEEIDALDKKVEIEKAKLIASPRSATENDTAAVVGMDGSKVVFSSRFDLEKEIDGKKKAQSAEISAKNFKKAQEIQHFIDKLESMREKLPTAAELRKKISSRKKEMNAAVADKRFADAERIDLDILVLEERLKVEQKNEPVKDVAKKLPVTVPTLSKNTSADMSIRSAPILKKGTAPENVGSGPKTVSGGDTNTSKIAFAPPSSVSRTKGFKDDVSDVTSIRSTKSDRKKNQANSQTSSLKSHSEEDRPVSKLRPKKPLISQQNDSVLVVTKMMAAKRASASLVVDDEGGLAGIVTGKQLMELFCK